MTAPRHLGPQFRVPHFAAKCRVCGGAFLAKCSLAETCPSEECQREARNAASRARARARREGRAA